MSTSFPNIKYQWNTSIHLLFLIYRTHAKCWDVFSFWKDPLKPNFSHAHVPVQGSNKRSTSVASLLRSAKSQNWRYKGIPSIFQLSRDQFEENIRTALRDFLELACMRSISSHFLKLNSHLARLLLDRPIQIKSLTLLLLFESDHATGTLYGGWVHVLWGGLLPPNRNFNYKNWNVKCHI
jgi:hypothetical protein